MRFSATTEYIGNSGVGSLSQSGGTNTVSGTLYLGYNSGSQRRLQLERHRPVDGPDRVRRLRSAAVGLVSADRRHQHDRGPLRSAPADSTSSPAARSRSAARWSTRASSSGGNSPATSTPTALVDLTAGTWKNLGDLSVNMGANSLLIVPAGFNPATGFAGYSSLGMTHIGGHHPQRARPGKGFQRHRLDQRSGCLPGDHHRQRRRHGINLNNGLVLSGNGNVNLGQQRKPDGQRLDVPASAAGRSPPPTSTSAAAARARLPTPAGRTTYSRLSISATTRPTAARIP